MVRFISTYFHILRLVLISFFCPCHKPNLQDQAKRLYRGNGGSPLRQLLRIKHNSSQMMKSHMSPIFTTWVTHPQDFITIKHWNRDLSATSDIARTTWPSFTSPWMYTQPWQQGSLLQVFLLWTVSIQAIPEATGSPLSTQSPRGRKRWRKAAHRCLRYQWWRL